MSSIQNTPLQKFNLSYRKILLATLFLGLYQLGSLGLTLNHGNSIFHVLQIISILSLTAIPIHFLSKRREWIHPLLLTTLLIFVFTISVTSPIIPIGFLLILPIYQIMIKKNQKKLFFVFLLVLTIYLVVTQSSLFIHLNVPNGHTLPGWDWLLSSFTILPAVYLLLDVSAIETQKILPPQIGSTPGKNAMQHWKLWISVSGPGVF